MDRRWIGIAAIALGVIVLLLVALPFLINVNSFRPEIESKATNALGRRVWVGDLSLRIFSGSIVAKSIAIADDTAFSKMPFLTAKSMKVGIELIPLIFSKRIDITEISLQNPQIALLQASNGRWNFSTIGGGGGASSSGPMNFSVAKLNVKQGRLSVAKVSSSPRQAVYDNVDITASKVGFGSPFPFELSAHLPGSGDVAISGAVGPINAQDASKTPFTTSVKINKMNLESIALFDPASGIAGVVNFDGTLTSNGSVAKAVGVMSGTRMKFSPRGTPGPKAVTIKHAVDFDLVRDGGNITQGDIAIGSAQAHLTGTFQIQGNTEVANLKLNAPNMPVDELESMLPSFGVTLPSGSQLKGGTLSADLAITGPMDKLVITGPIRVTNTKLANFDLGSKLGALATFAGKSISNPDTAIQNASLDARVAPEGMRATNINLAIPALGIITGAGTVSPAGALAFQMQANLQGGMMGQLSQVAVAGSGRSGIPFAIEGTMSNPRFVPELSGVATGLVENQLLNATKGQLPNTKSLGKALGGLLGGGKKQ